MRREKRLTGANERWEGRQCLIAFMEIKKFVANVFVPYPDFGLKLSLDSFHVSNLLMDDPGQAVLN